MLHIRGKLETTVQPAILVRTGPTGRKKEGNNTKRDVWICCRYEISILSLNEAHGRLEVVLVDVWPEQRKNPTITTFYYRASKQAFGR